MPETGVKQANASSPSMALRPSRLHMDGSRRGAFCVCGGPVTAGLRSPERDGHAGRAVAVLSTGGTFMAESACFHGGFRSFLNFDVAFWFIRAQHLLDIRLKKANGGRLNG
jgi:hypothetical protein